MRHIETIAVENIRFNPHVAAANNNVFPDVFNAVTSAFLANLTMIVQLV